MHSGAGRACTKDTHGRWEKQQKPAAEREEKKQEQKRKSREERRKMDCGRMEKRPVKQKK